MEYNFDNERPIYIQISNILRDDILSGKYQKQEKLPSVRDLAIIMKVNPNTMQKALSHLENEKLIYTYRTNGKYVTDDEELIEKTKKILAKEKVEQYLDSMKKIGIEKEEAIKYLKEIGEENGDS